MQLKIKEQLEEIKSLNQVIQQTEKVEYTSDLAQQKIQELTIKVLEMT